MLRTVVNVLINVLKQENFKIKLMQWRLIGITPRIFEVD